MTDDFVWNFYRRLDDSFDGRQVIFIANLSNFEYSRRKHKKTRQIIGGIIFLQGIEIRYSAHSAFTITSLVIFKNVSKIVLLRDEMPCR